MKKKITFLGVFIITVFFSTNLTAQYSTAWEVEVISYEHIVGYANCDDDSNIEFLVYYDDYDEDEKDWIKIIDGVTGEIEYQFTEPDWMWDLSTPSFVDVNGDGKSEILFEYTTWADKKYKLIKYGSLGVNENGVIISSFPNPFSNSVTIEYTVESEYANVSITITDQTGKFITTIEEGKVKKGDHQFMWNGKTQTGNSISSGNYFYSVEIDGQAVSRKMIKI